MKTAEQKERDRLRKREVRRLKKEGKWVSAKRSPKLSPNHDRNRPFNCENCGRLWFHRYAETNRFCSTDCSAAFSVNRWIDCSKCLAAVGYGAKTTGLLLGVSATSVTRQWKERGIKRAPVKYLKHQAGALKQRRRKLVSAYHSAWMRHEVQHNHPDWSDLWRKERSRRASIDAYRKNPYKDWPESKKAAHNKRTREYHQKRMQSDPDYAMRVKAYDQKWKEQNKQKTRNYVSRAIKKRRKTDPLFRIQCNLRHRFKELMQTTKRGGSKWKNSLTGCSTEKLREHLERQFTKRMNWENYGTYWHVDHIIPCAAFDQTDEKERAQCWHFTNLQPLEAKKNIKKSAQITEPQMSLLLSA